MNPFSTFSSLFESEPRVTHEAYSAGIEQLQMIGAAVERLAQNPSVMAGEKQAIAEQNALSFLASTTNSVVEAPKFSASSEVATEAPTYAQVTPMQKPFNAVEQMYDTGTNREIDNGDMAAIARQTIAQITDASHTPSDAQPDEVTQALQGMGYSTDESNFALGA